MRILNRKMFLLSAVWLFSFFLYGQEDFQVEWGKLNLKKGNLLNIIPKSAREFYTLRWSGGRMLGHFKASRYQGFEVKSSTRIRLKANAGIANFEGARVINGQFVVFLSDKIDGENRFYMQRYTEDLQMDGDVIHLASYALKRKNGKGMFDVKISQNGDFFGVVWQVLGKRESKHLYGFKVFNRDMQLVNDGEYTLPFDPELSEIHEHYVSEVGDYFLCVSEYDKGEKRRWLKSGSNYKTLHIYHIGDREGLQDFQFELEEGKQVITMLLQTSAENTFTLTGVYGEQETPGIAGVFYRKMNLITRQVIHESTRKFDEKVVTQYWTDKEKRRAEKVKEKGKGGPTLENYKMRDVTFLEDGSFVGSMEQHYIQTVSNANSRQIGQVSNMYYYYNDIVVYKVNSEGEFDWVKKIRKNQVSINDGGPYSSFSSFLGDGKAWFIFNDDARNYDSAGIFTEDDDIYSANYTRKRNTVSICSIDIETGVLSRTQLPKKEDDESILVVPKLFEVDVQSSALFLYSIAGRKEQMGMHRFQP